MEVTLSLDPGSSKIGWSLISSTEAILDCGLLSPISDTPKSMQFNLKMNLLIRRLIPEFEGLLQRATRVAWEIVPSFGEMSQRELVQATASTLKVLTFQNQYQYQQFTPQAWHKLFVGKGKCTKNEVKSLIIENKQLLLNEQPVPEDLAFDTYDAIAIGLTATRKDEWIKSERV